ncbi:MAG: hypothetical protein ACRDHD_02945 [Candidatus Limnocylindria bacterium]
MISQGAPMAGAAPRSRRRRRRRRRLLLLLLMALSALPSVVTSVISISLFVDRAILPTDAWAPSPLDIRAEPGILMEVTGMLPGDERSAELALRNLGVNSLRYAIQTDATDPDGRGLAWALEAVIHGEGSGCTAFDGPIFYAGPLAEARVGDPAIGMQAGDRTLRPADADLLCVRVSLPLGTGNAFQDASTSLAFSVLAEGMRP